MLFVPEGTGGCRHLPAQVQIFVALFAGMCYDRRSLKKGVIGSMILQQICVLLGVCLVGEAVSSLLPFAFPASVIAMVLLLILLFSGLVKPKHLGQTGNFLLDNMALFFVPSCTSIVKYLDVLLENAWVIVVISLITTPLVFAVTGHVVQLTVKLLKIEQEEG